MDQTKTRFFDRQVWRYQRRRATAAHLRSLEKPAFADLDSSESRLLIIPHDGPHLDSWKPFGGNWFFEIHQSAVDFLGHQRVRVVSIPPFMPVQGWVQRVFDEITTFKPTHIIGQIERDPNKSVDWNWDVFAEGLLKAPGATFIAVHYDLHFAWIQERLKRLHSILPEMVSMGLADPPMIRIPRGSRGIGPVTMPISEISLGQAGGLRSSTTRSEDLSFLGALYDNRLPILRDLEDAGLRVNVNPHHAKVADDYLGSRENKSDYLGYMRGIAACSFTLNFARASSGSDVQYKTRVVESAVLGTFLVTDDSKWAPNLLSPDLVVVVDDFRDAGTAVRDFQRLDGLQARRDALIEKGKFLARYHFWGELERALRSMGKLPLGTDAEARL